jgi:hypothetical protein
MRGSEGRGWVKGGLKSQCEKIHANSGEIKLNKKLYNYRKRRQITTNRSILSVATKNVPCKTVQDAYTDSTHCTCTLWRGFVRHCEILSGWQVGRERRVRIVYRGLGRAFVVHKNRDLEGNIFLAALGLVCMLVTSSQQGEQGVAVFL